MKNPSVLAQLSRKGVAPTRITRQITRRPELLPELLRGVVAEKPRVKYTSSKILRLLSEQAPSLLYPQIDFFIRLLDSDNSFLKWDAIRVLANLARVDSQDRLVRILRKFLAPIKGPVMITAANAIASAANIALARPALSSRIARAILTVEEAEYQTSECRNVAIGHAIQSLDRFCDQLSRKEPVLQFVRRQLENTRPATRRKAEAFLKKHAARRAERPCPRRSDSTAVAAGRPPTPEAP